MNTTLKTTRWEPDRISVPAKLLSVPMTPTALRLWISLAAFANSDSCCWPSTRRLLALMPDKTNDGSIRRARRELEQLNLLTVTSRFNNGRQTSNFYELRYPADARHTDRDGARNTARDGEAENARPMNLYKEELKKKEVNTLVTQVALNSSTSLHTDFFDRFWIAYDKKVGKKAAQIQWNKNVCDEITANLAINAALAQKTNVDRKFRKDPERWINQHRWTDEQTITTTGSSATISRLRDMVEVEGLNE
jgi:hypothetical protein